MNKVRLIILTDEEVEQFNIQKFSDKEIEDQGILIGWKAANVKCQTKNLKNQIIIKYKNTKVMKFEAGNVLLCKIDGCYNPSLDYINLCISHSEGKKLKPKYCKSPTICIKYAYYGSIDNEPLFCKIHSDNNMVNVKAFKTKKCKHPGCKVQPSFGFLGEKSQFCNEHKEKDMIDVINKKCVHEECKTRARYEYFGQITPKYCLEHKEKDMTDITRTKCSHKGCKTIPSFGSENDTKKYCETHKSADMKDIVNRKCSFSDCEIRPFFGVKGGKAERCKEHMDKSMVDVVSKRCIFVGCDVQSSFGYLFSKTHNHCLDHSTSNEYGESKRFPICSDLNCFNPAIFINDEGKSLQPIRCMNHKQEDDIEIIEKICSSCSIKVYIPEDKKICAECGQYRYKIIVDKEYEIKMFLRCQNIQFTHNKIVHLNGSSKRPDFLIDSIFGKIILECDEFQHKDIRYNKEEKRMITIYNDIQLLSKQSEVLFIRYNPDIYKGIQFTTNDRLEYLLIILHHFITLDKLNIKLGVVYLFYDGFDGNPKVQELVINELLS